MQAAAVRVDEPQRWRLVDSGRGRAVGRLAGVLEDDPARQAGVVETAPDDDGLGDAIGEAVADDRTGSGPTDGGLAGPPK